MKKVIGLLLISFFLGNLAFSQSPEEEGRLLNTVELKQQPWYYSLDSALANPDKVYKLSLANMDMKVLPAEIGQFKNLQLLNLEGNKFKTLPEEIGQLQNLQFLNLFHNKLKYLPLEVKSLHSLEVLYLGRNKISEIPIWVGGLGKLRRLDLTANRLTPLEVSYIKDMLRKCDVTI